MAIDEALECKRAGTKKVIVFNLSGHGHFDMQAYDDYHHGRIREPDAAAMDFSHAIEQLPKVGVG